MASETQFPSLEKTLIGVFDLESGINVGTLSTGAGLNYLRVIGGKLCTVEGFRGPQLNSVIDQGEDWAYADNDGKRLRLNVRILTRAANGDLLALKYTGIITLTPEIGAVFAGNGSTVPFGNIVISAGFETGSETYKEFENSIFVGTGRFRVNDNGTVSVEYGLSRVLV